MDQGSFLAGAITAALTLDDSQFRTACQAALDGVDKLGKGMDSGSQALKTAGKEMAIAGAAITTALTAIVLKTVDVEHEFKEMSEKTGIATEDLSSLSLAANKGGTDIDGVVRGMKFLAAQMMDTAKATEGQVNILSALGIKATDAQGNMRDMNAVLYDLADKFAGMKDGAIKANLAVKIFGRAGLDMIPMLNMGSKGLKENAELAAKFGIVVSGEAATAADKFKEKMKDMEAASAGLGRVIGESLMPMVKSIIEGATNATVAVKNWALAHPDLSQALAALALGLGGVLTIGGALALTIPKLIESFGTFATVLKLTAGELALTLAGFTVLVGAAVYAYNTITQLTKAKDYASEADLRAYQRTEMLGQKLRLAADAAGITRAAFHELTLKYHENYAEMAMAIEKNKEGVVLQSALAKVGKEQAASHDLAAKAAKNQEEEMKKLLEGLNKTTPAAKTLKEELNLTFTADIAAKIAKIEEALIKYKGQLAPDMEAKLKDELSKLSNEYGIATGKLQPLMAAHSGMNDLMAKAPALYSEEVTWSGRYDDELKELGVMTIPQIKEATRKYIEQQRILTELWHLGELTGEEYRIKMDEIQTKIRELGTDGKTTGADLAEGAATANEGWSDFFSSVTSKWSDVIKGFLTGETSIVTTWNRMWKTMGQTVYDVLAKQIATALVTFIERQFIPTVEKGANAIKDVGSAASGIATTVSGIFTTIGTIITGLATSIATSVGTIATGIATALVTIAEAVATAAGLLAAAAKYILIVAAIALVIYAAFSIVSGIIGAIFGSGGSGGSGSDESHWLKLIHGLTKETHDWIQEIWSYYLGAAITTADESRDYLSRISELSFGFRDQFNTMIGHLQGINENIANLRGASRGAVSERTELMVLHGRPQDREFVMREGQLAQAISSGGRSAPLELRFETGGAPLKITDTVKGIIIRLIPELTKKEIILVHPAGVRVF
jgi:hypothetical protein